MKCYIVSELDCVQLGERIPIHSIVDNEIE